MNYPVKDALIQMTEYDLLDMEDEIVRFAVSWVTMRVCQTGTSTAVAAWNHHSIPGMRLLLFYLTDGRTYGQTDAQT